MFVQSQGVTLNYVNDHEWLRIQFQSTQSINQSNFLLYIMERVHIPGQFYAEGLAQWWVSHLRVGSSRHFLTEDLHNCLSWVSSSDKPQTSRSSSTDGAHFFMLRARSVFPAICLVLMVIFSLENPMNSPNHLGWHSRTRTARSRRPSLCAKPYFPLHQSI